MKKTLTINISGIIFNIDEDAYNKLRSYLESIKTHFRNKDGNDEIINDIESRIAEILQEKLHDKKQVIIIQDIDEVILTMGQPSQFEEEPAETGDEQTFEAKPFKRLYRDGDNKWIGGVASGIAAYFHIDPVWVRLLFFVSLFVGGTGFIVYLILWIAVPEAKTTTEKLEMKGEKVNITNIEKSIREEIDQLTNKINDLKNQAKGTYKKKAGSGKTVFENILSIFLDILRIFLRVVLIIIGIVLVITGILVLITLLSGVFGWGAFFFVNEFESVPFSLSLFSNVFLGPGFNLSLLKLSILLLAGIPFLMLIYNGIRLLFGLDGIKYIGLTAINLWIIGLIMASYFSIKIYNHYKYEGTHNETVVLDEPVADTVYLQLQNYFYETEPLKHDYFILGDPGILITEEGNFNCIPHLRVRTGEGSQFKMEMKSYARGKTRQLALERAEEIGYTFTTTDSSIVMAPFFNFPDHNSWHGEQLDIILWVPEKSVVHYDENMWKITERYDHNRRSDTRRENNNHKGFFREFSMVLFPEFHGFLPPGTRIMN